jgi:hypothetical protein
MMNTNQTYSNTPWKDIPIDGMLDFTEAHTAVVHRFDRIMQYKNTVATNETLMEVRGTMIECEQCITNAIRAIESSAEASASSQRRLQRAANILSCMILFATIVYAYVAVQVLEIEKARFHREQHVTQAP